MRSLLVGRNTPYVCVLLAFAMLLAPAAVLRAEEQPTISRSFLTQQSVVAACLKPKRVLTNPANAMLPIEVAKAAGEKYLGMDPANIERAVLVVEPPLGANLFYAMFVEADKAWDLTKFDNELTAHTTPGDILGKPCLISDEPSAPCIMVLNEKMLVVASDGMLKKLMGPDRGKADSILVDLATKRGTQDDLYVAVDMVGLRPLISLGMLQAAQQAPPETHKYFDIPSLLESAELSVTLDGSVPSRLLFHAANESDAAKVETLLDEGVELARTQMRADMEAQLSQMRASDNPVEQAMAAYSDRMMDGYLKMFVPKRDGNTFVLFDTSAGGGSQIASVGVIGVLVALLLPAVQAAREAARRNMSLNNTKQLMLAYHNYHDTQKKLPAHAIYSKDGKPLLSWRVALLPYLEGGELYKQFHLDEPWDSEHNRKLIPLMPLYFAGTSSSLDPSLGKTNYLAPVGDGMVFDGTSVGAGFADIKDGMSNTIMILEVDDESAVEWTKPDDWELDPKDPLKGLGGMRAGVFIAGFADGHAAGIATEIDPKVFKAMLTKDGGEVVNAP
jgi:hypothetical protein